jgi:hypothetical protein
MKLRPQQEVDEITKDFVETTTYVDENGNPVEFDQLPPDPEQDDGDN